MSKVIPPCLDTDSFVVHRRTGNVYQILGRIKVKIAGSWVEYVHYCTTDAVTYEDYARTEEDMRAKFEHYVG